MRLNNQELSNREEWEKAGYHLPLYNRNELIEKTKKHPVWIHFGAGNIFRAFQANVVQNLLNEAIIDFGLIVAEGYDYELLEKVYRPYDNLSILVTLKADGTMDKTVIGSITESCIVDSNCESEFSRLKEIFRSNSLQMVSFTITEKGYNLTDSSGNILSSIKKDYEEGPKEPQSYLGKVVSLLYERYLAGKHPIAFVSMDNCSHNGDKLYTAVHAIAHSWLQQGFIDSGFINYIEDEGKVSFPWTMIDKITPRPDDMVLTLLKNDCIDGMEQIVTAKNTYAAPFVNAEECEYLVIEDVFPNGRPALEKGGILFATRETVDRVEKMKVCTCLNPLHTTLAIFGCLLGYQRISDEMKNPLLKELIYKIGYEEGLPVVVDPGIIHPKQFIDEVVQLRIPNPFLPDTPQRIATDTSLKLAIRFGETIKAYQRMEGRSVKTLRFIPLVYAAWLRYLLAVDDEGKEFELSPDPILQESVSQDLKKIRLGQAVEVKQIINNLLSNEQIFGVNLYETGLDGLVEEYFQSMISSIGAVKITLRKALADPKNTIN